MADILSLLGTFLLRALSLIYVWCCQRLKQKVIPMLGQVLLIVICVGLFGYLLAGLLWRRCKRKSQACRCRLIWQPLRLPALTPPFRRNFKFRESRKREAWAPRIPTPGECARGTTTTGIFGRAASECSGIESRFGRELSSEIFCAASARRLPFCRVLIRAAPGNGSRPRVRSKLISAAKGRIQFSCEVD